MKFERDLAWIAVSILSLTFVACVTPQASDVSPVQLVITKDSMEEDLSGRISLDFAKYNDWKVERREVSTESLNGNKDVVVLQAKADCYATRTQDLSRVSFCDQVVRLVDPTSNQVLVEAHQRDLGDADHLPSWEPLVDKVHDKVGVWKGRIPSSDSSDQQVKGLLQSIDRADRNTTTPVQRTNY